MDAGKSLQLCLIQHGVRRDDLAKKIEVTPTYISKLCNKRDCSGSMLTKLAGAFDIKVSEFVALGE